MFFDGWAQLGRVLVVGVVGYASLMVLLRGFGSRTLSKMNAFDFIVTVALGSTLATALLTETVSVSEGVTGMLVLVTLQFLVSWSIARWRRVAWLVRNEPALLFYEGEFLEGQLRHHRVTRADILAAIRSSGISSSASVRAVVLEANGDLSVVGSGQPGDALGAALSVPGPGE